MFQRFFPLNSLLFWIFYLLTLYHFKHAIADIDRKGQGDLKKIKTHPASNVDYSKCRDDQPYYLSAVKWMMRKMAWELGYGSNYDICQNIPWYQIHRNLDLFLGTKENPKYLLPGRLDRMANLTKLVLDLHCMDLPAGYLRQLRPVTARNYTELNEENEAKCMDLVFHMKIEAIKKSTSSQRIKKLRKRLAVCLNSAPANMRPGKKVKNRLIGCHFDPNVLSYAGEHVLTSLSKEHAQTYESAMVTNGKTLKENKVVTSDLVPTTRRLWQPTIAPNIDFHAQSDTKDTIHVTKRPLFVTAPVITHGSAHNNVKDALRATSAPYLTLHVTNRPFVTAPAIPYSRSHSNAKDDIRITDAPFVVDMLALNFNGNTKDANDVTNVPFIAVPTIASGSQGNAKYSIHVTNAPILAAASTIRFPVSHSNREQKIRATNAPFIMLPTETIILKNIKTRPQLQRSLTKTKSRFKRLLQLTFGRPTLERLSWL